MLANATRRWQPCFMRYSLTGDRFCCALENYSFGKVQDSRDVRCVRLEIFVADQSSGLSELGHPSRSSRVRRNLSSTPRLVVRLGRLFWNAPEPSKSHPCCETWLAAPNPVDCRASITMFGNAQGSSKSCLSLTVMLGLPLIPSADESISGLRNASGPSETSLPHTENLSQSLRISLECTFT